MELRDEPQCTGPFSDAHECPVHDPRKRASVTPMTAEQWQCAYIDRMVERGVNRAYAEDVCKAGDVDLSIDPADAADDEMSYWENDGDE